MDSCSYILRQSDLAWRQVGDEVIALDLGGGDYFSLNASGAVLWAHLAGAPEGISVDDLSHSLVATYGLTDVMARRDTVGFLEEVLRIGLVRLVETRGETAKGG